MTSLLCFAIVEWHQVARVLRQLGGQKYIPEVPLNINKLHHTDEGALIIGSLCTIANIMRYRMSGGVELLSFPSCRASFCRSRTSNGTQVLHVVSCREGEPEVTVRWSNSQLKHLLMPHHRHLCEDHIMHPARVEGRG